MRLLSDGGGDRIGGIVGVWAAHLMFELPLW
jgi:hypothetical protein